MNFNQKEFQEVDRAPLEDSRATLLLYTSGVLSIMKSQYISLNLQIIIIIIISDFLQQLTGKRRE